MKNDLFVVVFHQKMTIFILLLGTSKIVKISQKWSFLWYFYGVIRLPHLYQHYVTRNRSLKHGTQNTPKWSFLAIFTPKTAIFDTTTYIQDTMDGSKNDQKWSFLAILSILVFSITCTGNLKEMAQNGHFDPFTI